MIFDKSIYKITSWFEDIGLQLNIQPDKKIEFTRLYFPKMMEKDDKIMNFLIKNWI